MEEIFYYPLDTFVVAKPITLNILQSFDSVELSPHDSGQAIVSGVTITIPYGFSTKFLEPECSCQKSVRFTTLLYLIYAHNNRYF